MEDSASYIGFTLGGMKLDNGQPYPTKKPMKNTKWDASTKTLTAVVDWRETTVGGIAEMHLTMIFGSDFKSIEGGINLCKDKNGNTMEAFSMNYGKDIMYLLKGEAEQDPD